MTKEISLEAKLVSVNLCNTITVTAKRCLWTKETHFERNTFWKDSTIGLKRPKKKLYENRTVPHSTVVGVTGHN